MNAVQLIKKKRSGNILSREEIAYLIENYTKGDLPDYQMSAFLMAVYFKGMNARETADLVDLMMHSGAVVNFSKLKRPKLDKHSTGGIGDKTTIILAPLLASCGIAYPTIAGRGLAHTGGTVDKFEAIPGFNCKLSLKRFEELVGSTGLAFIGQTEEICPADRKLYALRDVTGTVESIPLIVASIMSKKLAEGIDGIVFDVKTGSGAFMKSEEEALQLAKSLVETAKMAGKQARALVTDMSQPLGFAVGNAIEMNECVAFLRQGPQDQPPHPFLKKIVMELALEMYSLSELIAEKKPSARESVEKILEESLQSGKAYSKFLEIVSLQDGDTEALDRGLPLATKKISVLSPKTGFLNAINAEQVGLALIEIGGGRLKTSDKIDAKAGFWFEKFLGDKVKKDEPMIQIFSRDAKSAEIAKNMLLDAISIGSEKINTPQLIRHRI